MQFRVMLVNIRSVHNVGSIFRTADAAGFEKIYLCGITPTPLDRFGRVRSDFHKVSLGAEDFVPWEYAKNAGSTINKLKADGWTIIAVEQSKKSVPCNAIPKKMIASGKICLVMGAEVEGFPAAILKKADVIVEIPMRGKKESLNVSVAFGIVAFGLRA